MSTSISTITDACELFIGACINKSILKKITSYSAEICVTEATLNSARENYLEETNSIIEEFQNMESIHQIATSFRHCSTEIQYFIIERAALIRSMAYRYPDKYSISFDPDVSICVQISHMLLAVWEYTELLSQGNLNSLVSQCFRGIL